MTCTVCSADLTTKAISHGADPAAPDHGGSAVTCGKPVSFDKDEAAAVLAWVARLEGYRTAALVRAHGLNADGPAGAEFSAFVERYPAAPLAFQKLARVAGCVERG
jgi:hypothetical protein